MIPSDLATRLKILIESTVQPLTAVTEISSELPHFDAGQRFSALIQTALPDGTFRALVAGRNVTLALPESAKSGDVLELVVTDSKNATVYAQLADPSKAAIDANSKPKLSQAGQLIGQLLTGRFGEPEPVVLANGRPLLSAPPTRDLAPTAGASTPVNSPGAVAATQASAADRNVAPALAAALRQAVSKSGLFFEAHQARWVQGNMPMETLMGEPQAREGLRQTLTQHAQAGASLSPQLRAAVQASGDPNLMKAAMAIVQASPKSAEAKALQAAININELNKEVQTTAKNALRIPDSLMPLVHQQLEALATHHVAWQGQVWPGQHILWDVYEPGQKQSSDSGSDNDENQREWKSTLHLTLPKLGGIDAQLILTPAGIALRLDASEADTAERMRAAEQQLRETLEAAGIPVTGVAIVHHASA